MMDFKVEYLPTRYASPKPCAPDDVAYVRLAEVETLIQELEWAMENIIGFTQHKPSDILQDKYKHAQACLANIAAWRTGQEEQCKCGFPHGPGGK